MKYYLPRMEEGMGVQENSTKPSHVKSSFFHKI